MFRILIGHVCVNLGQGEFLDLTSRFSMFAELQFWSQPSSCTLQDGRCLMNRKELSTETGLAVVSAQGFPFGPLSKVILFKVRSVAKGNCYERTTAYSDFRTDLQEHNSFVCCSKANASNCTLGTLSAMVSDTVPQTHVLHRSA